MRNIYLLFLLFLSLNSLAQDTIYYTRGNKVACNILKISDAEIEYKKSDNPNGPLYTVRRTSVQRIVYKNGTVDELNPGNEKAVPLPKAARHGIKADLLAPAFHKITLGYEYVLNRDIHFEGSLSYISSRLFPDRSSGTMYQTVPSVQGMGLRLGTKLMFAGDNITNGSWGGWFLRIDLLYSRAAVKNIMYYPLDRDVWYPGRQGNVNVDQYGLTFNLGWQILLHSRLLVQFNGGIGYINDYTTFLPAAASSGSGYTYYYENRSFRSGLAKRIDDSALCFSGNLCLGYAFGGKKNRQQ